MSVKGKPKEKEKLVCYSIPICDYHCNWYSGDDNCCCYPNIGYDEHMGFRSFSQEDKRNNFPKWCPLPNLESAG